LIEIRKTSPKSTGKKNIVWKEYADKSAHILSLSPELHSRRLKHLRKVGLDKELKPTSPKTSFLKIDLYGFYILSKFSEKSSILH